MGMKVFKKKDIHEVRCLLDLNELTENHPRVNVYKSFHRFSSTKDIN